MVRQRYRNPPAVIRGAFPMWSYKQHQKCVLKPLVFLANTDCCICKSTRRVPAKAQDPNGSKTIHQIDLFHAWEKSLIKLRDFELKYLSWNTVHCETNNLRNGSMTEGPPRAQHDDLALTNYVRYVAIWVTFTEAMMDQGTE